MYNQIKSLFDQFVSGLEPLLALPTSITMHLLLHLSEQIKVHGAVSYASMFPFEAQFVHFKRLMQGTLGHGDQICDKNILAWVLSHYLIRECPSHYMQLLTTLNLSRTCSQEMQLLDNDRLLKDGTVYHTSKYNKKRGSASCYCILEGNLHYEILAFIHENDTLFVKGKRFDFKNDILSEFVPNAPIEDYVIDPVLISLQSQPFFSVCVPTDHVDCFPASTIKQRCLLYYIQFKESSLCVLSPAIDVFEYS
jgi:hypothetical protein